MAAKEPMQGRFSDVHSGEPRDDEGIRGAIADPLALDIEDDELAEVVNKRLEDIRNYYRDEYDLYARRTKNETYLFGRQLLDEEKEHLLKDYESRFQDNVLFEIAASLKPLAMSRLPDLIVTPGNDSEQSRLMAKEISKAVDTQIKARENRSVLGLAFKHLPVYMTGVIKARWDNELDDYLFEVIHPDMIDVDYQSPDNTADNMKLISQIVPWTVEEVLMRFPSQKEAFLKELQKDGIAIKDQKPSWKQLATTIQIREVWFKWYKKHDIKEWEPIWGVLWKYQDCILKKMKNPNFDYEGEERYFTYDQAGNKRTPSNNELLQLNIQLMLSGQPPENMQKERVYHNYLDHPPMPYYFMGYDQWGKQPYDETSWLEQSLKNQEALDKRGKQIEEELDQRGHNIWSKETGLKSGDVQAMDSNDPDEDYVIDGDVNANHKYIPPVRPDTQEFQDLDRIKQRMHELAGDNAVQGTIQSDTATTNQIAREANFTRADDLVEDTINAAAEWMARMSLHFIKLRYTEDHFRKLLGIAGSVVYMKLNRNMVDEGMQVMIKASGTDRLQAKNNAIDLAKLKMIDVVNFMRDMGYPDYQERAEMLMTMQTDLSTYMVKYVQNLQTSAEMAAALEKSPEQETQPMMPQQQMMGMPTQQPFPSQAGMSPAGQAPQQPTPGNTAQMPATPPVGMNGAPPASPRNL